MPTKLERELKKRGISWYRLSKLLGKSPASMSGVYKDKVQGKDKIRYEELVEICEKVGEFSGDPIDIEDIAYSSVWIKLK